MPESYDEIKIIIDTREQQPWSFDFNEIAVAKLDTGDYSVEGLEDILCIERKKSVSEIANNIVESRYKDWTKRMSKYKHKFLMLEFDLDEVFRYPRIASVPKKLWEKIRVSPKFIIKCIIELQVYYGIHVVFCGDHENAQRLALSIMKKVYQNETKNRV